MPWFPQRLDSFCYVDPGYPLNALTSSTSAASFSTKEQDDDRQADRHLGCSHGDDEKRQRSDRSISPQWRAKAINARLAAFHISSTHISITKGLRRSNDAAGADRKR